MFYINVLMSNSVCRTESTFYSVTIKYSTVQACIDPVGEGRLPMLGLWGWLNAQHLTLGLVRLTAVYYLCVHISRGRGHCMPHGVALRKGVNKQLL